MPVQHAAELVSGLKMLDAAKRETISKMETIGQAEGCRAMRRVQTKLFTVACGVHFCGLRSTLLVTGNRATADTSRKLSRALCTPVRPAP